MTWSISLSGHTDGSDFDNALVTNAILDFVSNLTRLSTSVSGGASLPHNGHLSLGQELVKRPNPYGVPEPYPTPPTTAVTTQPDPEPTDESKEDS